MQSAEKNTVPLSVTKFLVSEANQLASIYFSTLCVDSINEYNAATVDCRLHRQMAHQAVLEWTLAMSSLDLPPYVVEHIFTSLQSKQTNPDYQQRKGTDFLFIPTANSCLKIDENFVHLIVEEREHAENIKLFISVHKAVRKKLE